MTYKDLKVSLRNEERLDVYFYGPREEKSYFCPNYTVKQVSYCVSVMSTTLNIAISIFTIGGFRDGPSEDYRDCFSPRNIDF